MHTLGAGMERGEKEKKYTKTNLTKTQTNQKNPRNPNRLKSQGSVALCILLPGGTLRSATGALSVPFFSYKFCLIVLFLQGINSHQSCLRSHVLHAAFSEVIGSRVQLWVLLKF